MFFFNMPSQQYFKSCLCGLSPDELNFRSLKKLMKLSRQPNSWPPLSAGPWRLSPCVYSEESPKFCLQPTETRYTHSSLFMDSLEIELSRKICLALETLTSVEEVFTYFLLHIFWHSNLNIFQLFLENKSERSIVRGVPFYQGHAQV